VFGVSCVECVLLEEMDGDDDHRGVQPQRVAGPSRLTQGQLVAAGAVGRRPSLSARDGAGGSAGAGECLGDEVVAADEAEIVRERGAYGDGHVVKAATEKLKAFGGVGGLLAKFYESWNGKSERDALKQVMLIRISLRLRTA
jgi:hypothetical protein